MIPYYYKKARYIIYINIIYTLKLAYIKFNIYIYYYLN
jgi:hypothetical protein